jgi:hypothetical protein
LTNLKQLKIRHNTNAWRALWDRAVELLPQLRDTTAR